MEALWCIEFAMLYPHPDSGWWAERCRSFNVTQFSGYLNSKPWGAWALAENADGYFQWKPIKGRIGPRMLAMRDAVSLRPGCSREEAVQAVDGYLPGSGRYGPLGRTLDVGLIIADWPDRDHARLFASGAARRLFYLRRELLEPGLTAGQVKVIHDEIDELQAVQALTWTSRSVKACP